MENEEFVEDQEPEPESSQEASSTAADYDKSATLTTSVTQQAQQDISEYPLVEESKPDTVASKQKVSFFFSGWKKKTTKQNKKV